MAGLREYVHFAAVRKGVRQSLRPLLQGNLVSFARDDQRGCPDRADLVPLHPPHLLHARLRGPGPEREGQRRRAGFAKRGAAAVGPRERALGRVLPRA